MAKQRKPMVIPEGETLPTRKEDYSKRPIMISGDFPQKPDVNQQPKIEKDEENLRSTMSAIQASEKFKDTKEIEEKRPYDNDNLIALALVQGGGALLGGLTTGWRGAAKASRAGEEAMQTELGRRADIDKLRMKSQMDIEKERAKEKGPTSMFGKGLVEMTKNGKKLMVTQPEAHKMSQQGWTKMRTDPFMDIEGKGLVRRSKVSPGERKAQYQLVTTPEGIKRKVGIGEAEEVQKKGFNVLTNTATGETFTHSEPSHKHSLKAKQALKTNPVYKMYSLADGEIKTAKALAGAVHSSGKKLEKQNFVALNMLVNKMIRASGDMRINESDKLSFKNPESVEDSLKSWILRKSKGRFDVTLSEMEKVIDILERNNKKVMDKQIVKTAESFSRSSKTPFPRWALRDILSGETLTKEDAKKRDGDKAGPHGNTVIQDGVEFNWNPKTRKYE